MTIPLTIADRAAPVLLTKSAIAKLKPCPERWDAIKANLGDGALTAADGRAAGATF